MIKSKGSDTRAPTRLDGGDAGDPRRCRLHHAARPPAAAAAAEVARNGALTPIRAAIEPVFGTLKRSYDWTRVRYRGLARNAAHLDLLCLALNLQRLKVLTR